MTKAVIIRSSDIASFFGGGNKGMMKWVFAAAPCDMKWAIRAAKAGVFKA